MKSSTPPAGQFTTRDRDLAVWLVRRGFRVGGRSFDPGSGLTSIVFVDVPGDILERFASDEEARAWLGAWRQVNSLMKAR